MKRYKKIYHVYYIYIMAQELDDFFCTDFNNWNYNEMINKPDIDPDNKKRKINISGNNSYNLMT